MDDHGGTLGERSLQHAEFVLAADQVRPRIARQAIAYGAAHWKPRCFLPLYRRATGTVNLSSME